MRDFITWLLIILPFTISLLCSINFASNSFNTSTFIGVFGSISSFGAFGLATYTLRNWQKIKKAHHIDDLFLALKESTYSFQAYRQLWPNDDVLVPNDVITDAVSKVGQIIPHLNYEQCKELLDAWDDFSSKTQLDSSLEPAHEFARKLESLSNKIAR